MDEPTGPDAKLTCSNCGELNPAQAKACLKCAAPFSQEDPLPVSDVEGPVEIVSTPAAPMENPAQLLGRIVNGKYEVLSILGEGGMGVVYKVRHLILQNRNTFALKILHPRLCAQGDFQTRFLREVEIAMELTHENIVQIRDFGLTEQNLLFYTMDFFAGKSLKAIIDEEKSLPPERVIRVARQILLALAEAHKVGIIHRDLKPDNLLIEKVDDDLDNVRILDFGIAKVLVGDLAGEEKNLTQGNVIGTPKYMSPEQASGESIDARSDLYALGCILYELLTGKPPFSGKSARSILVAHLTVPPPSFEKMSSGLHVPPQLERLVFQLLEKDRGDRPPSAEAVLALLDGKPLASIEGASRPARAGGKPRWIVPATLAGGVLVAAGLSATFFRSGGEVEATTRRGETAAESSEKSSENSPSAALLRCNVCGSVYAKGAKVGGMCHGEPLVEVEK